MAHKESLRIANTVYIPYFVEATSALLCKKLYAQDLKPECFTTQEQELNGKWYPNADYHTLYIAEITKILVKE